MSTSQASRDVNKDGIDDDEQDVKEGTNQFGNFLQDFTGSKVSKDDSLGRDIRMGIAGSEYGKFTDDFRTRGQADDQAARSKDYVNTMANIETRSKREDKADTFAYQQRDYSGQMENTDEMANRDLGRFLVATKATGEQSNENYQSNRAADNFRTEFQDKIKAKAKARDKQSADAAQNSF